MSEERIPLGWDSDMGDMNEFYKPIDPTQNNGVGWALNDDGRILHKSFVRFVAFYREKMGEESRRRLSSLSELRAMAGWIEHYEEVVRKMEIPLQPILEQSIDLKTTEDRDRAWG